MKKSSLLKQLIILICTILMASLSVVLACYRGPTCGRCSESVLATPTDCFQMHSHDPAEVTYCQGGWASGWEKCEDKDVQFSIQYRNQNLYPAGEGPEGATHPDAEYCYADADIPWVEIPNAGLCGAAILKGDCPGGGE